MKTCKRCGVRYDKHGDRFYCRTCRSEWQVDRKINWLGVRLRQFAIRGLFEQHGWDEDETEAVEIPQLPATTFSEEDLDGLPQGGGALPGSLFGGSLHCASNAGRIKRAAGAGTLGGTIHNETCMRGSRHG